MSESGVAAERTRQELYDVVRSDASFETTAREALRLGKQYLGVDNGHLTRIDPRTDHWEVMVSTDPMEGSFAAGQEHDLGSTYCRKTLEGEGQLALHDAPNQGWADDPAFEAHGLHCYHGTRLLLEGEPYGTVCFVAEDPRDPFDAEERMFTELLARLLERELERERHAAELTRQADLAGVLNRVLRHNLRNELTVIRGNTRFAARRLEDDAPCRVAIDHIDSLVRLSRKAGRLDQVVEAESGREAVDVSRLVRWVVDRVADEHPEASISVEAADSVPVRVQPNFERAVEELVENAAKHAGERPTVAVTVERVPNAVEIRVADDGPGLADQEAHVVETGSETPLSHGSGLGLWLAYWIVTSHGGSIEADADGEGTTMTVSVPRRPSTEFPTPDVEEDL